MSDSPIGSRRFTFEVDPRAGRVTKRASGPEGRARLATEAAALDRLRGAPGVVALLDWDGEALVTQWVRGERLSARLRRGGAASSLAARLCRVLAGVHARGVAHGDLSAANILVTADDEPVLVDFELARLPGHAHGGGTLATAAPELRWLPDPRLRDRRADIYSLGLLLGRLLFDRRGARTGEHLARHLLGERPGGLPEWLLAMTAPRRTERPLDLAAVASRIEGGPVDPPRAGGRPALPAALAGEDDEDLIELVPIDGLDAELPDREWRGWADEARRARALRAGGQDWEAAAVERRLGLPWRVLREARLPGVASALAADLLLALDAPEAARDALARCEGTLGVAAALSAEAQARLGNLPAASRAVGAALRARPASPEELRVFWPAIARALRSAGASDDLMTFLPLLPMAERRTAAELSVPALLAEMRALEDARGRPREEAGLLAPFAGIALGAAAAEAALVASELTLSARLPAGDSLREAGACLARVMPDDPVGPALLAVAARSAGDADAGADALATLRARVPGAPALGETTDAAEWVHRVVSRPALSMPRWAATEGEAAGEEVAADVDPRRPLERLAEEGISGALDELRGRLVKAPRNPHLWTLVLQVWATTSATDAAACERGFDALIDALTASGMPAPTLLSWRMRARMLAGAPGAAITELVQASGRHATPWPAWVVAIEAWIAMGEPARAREAVVRLAAAGAPPKLVEGARRAVDRVA